MSRIQATPDIGADENDDVPPQPPQSFVQLSSQARRVVDSDEEVCERRTWKVSQSSPS